MRPSIGFCSDVELVGTLLEFVGVLNLQIIVRICIGMVVHHSSSDDRTRVYDWPNFYNWAVDISEGEVSKLEFWMAILAKDEGLLFIPGRGHTDGCLSRKALHYDLDCYVDSMTVPIIIFEVPAV